MFYKNVEILFLNRQPLTANIAEIFCQGSVKNRNTEEITFIFENY